jgi:hypothetical protein
LKLFPFDVYFNPNSLANILSLAQVQKMFRVTMDTAEEPTMMVHLSDDLILKFTQCGSGLYFYDIKEISANVNSYSFLSTVRSNKDYFNRKEIEGADKARLLQGNIGWPSTQDLKELIASNQIIDKFVILKLEGQFVEIMCKVNPEYLQDVRFEYGKKTLYLRVLKALYGCIESALLWYNLYVSTLKDMGFVINPYDRCVANMIIDGSQCTILWYVDDNKLSHMSENVVTSVIDHIKKHFGDLVISRGKEHKFLGMNITFNDNGSLEIEMKKYIEEAIESFGEDVSKNVASAATKMLFEVDASTKVLDVKRADIFHSVVAKLLWVMK